MYFPVIRKDMKTRLNSYSRYIAITLIVSIIAAMIAATVLEKIYGTVFVSKHIYSSPLFISAWIILSISSLVYVCARKLYKRLITFFIHISFLVILSGAIVTHTSGIQGYLHIRKDIQPADTFCTYDKGTHMLPFSISLSEFTVKHYPGTQSAMDYVSKVTITDNGTNTEAEISMNNILEYRNYRFYQSGFDEDRNGATLSVYYDPYGIMITYTGYLLLFISMVLFFLEKNSMFRRLIKQARQSGMVVLFMTLSCSSMYASADVPQTIPYSTARSMCRMHIYYNRRICPLQTLAYDFVNKIYGKSSYKGLTPEEVLTGWFFYYDDWKEEQFIRIKSSDVQEILGSGKYARISDFVDTDGFKIERVLQNVSDINQRRALEEANEKFSIISMLCTGSILKIFPLHDNEDSSCRWYSVSEKLPDDIPHDKWMFLKYSMNYLSENIYKGNYKEAEKITGKIRKFQTEEAKEGIPDDFRFRTEIFYNKWTRTRLAAMLCLTIGICGFIYQNRLLTRRKSIHTGLNKALTAGLYIISFYIFSIIIMRGIISGHFPIANGFETMMFMAATSFIITIAFRRHLLGFSSFGYIIGGLAQLVAMFGESNPAITPLMPVLSSPLLSIHVMTIMISYSLFALMMLNGITAETMLHGRDDMTQEINKLATVSRIMLYPAVFLLAAGIFIGAVWANVSWGRYWGWDPKEVWALITMLIYSAALHSGTLNRFGNNVFFHRFSIIAFLSVIITYFGVNFIMGGMHSYA